jgi:hypothetical protein
MVGRGWDVVVPVAQAQQNQLKPARLDATGVLGLIGMPHVRPFKDDFSVSFRLPVTDSLPSSCISAASRVNFEDCNLPGHERPAR